MSEVKRLRIFAGPNGSGKSTLFEQFSKNYNPGIFVNSDLIEKEIKEKRFYDLANMKLDLNQNDLNNFLEKETSKSLIKKSAELNHHINLEIRENIVVVKSTDSSSYESALISSFIREELIKGGISFSFETVMSHPSKLEEIKAAKRLGYKTYLYFICVDEPLINISRVQNRVAKGGHDVSTEKIISRYSQTLKNLYPCLQIVDKAFLFDNSNEMTLIAELENGVLTIKVDETSFPNWFIENVINLT